MHLRQLLRSLAIVLLALLLSSPLASHAASAVSVELERSTACVPLPEIVWLDSRRALLTAPAAGELRLVRGGVEQPGTVVVEEPGAIVLPPPGPRDAGWRPRPGDVWCYAGSSPRTWG